MRIGILNAGNVGRALARAWLQTGHELLVSKSGSQEKLDAFVEENPRVRRGTPADAASFGEIVLFSVYWPRLDEMLEATGSMADKIVIDTMNPLEVSGDFEHSHDKLFMERSSTSEELRRRRPDARVVKAFNTMPSDLLDRRRWPDPQAAPPIFLAGDDSSAKAKVAQLARDAGFAAVDAGPLAAARSIEQLGVLMHYVGENQFGGDFTRLAPSIALAPALRPDA